MSNEDRFSAEISAVENSILNLREMMEYDSAYLTPYFRDLKLQFLRHLRQLKAEQRRHLDLRGREPPIPIAPDEVQETLPTIKHASVS